MTHPSQGTGKTCCVKAEKSEYPYLHFSPHFNNSTERRLQGLGLSLAKGKLSRKARAVYKNTELIIRKNYFKKKRTILAQELFITN